MGSGFPAGKLLEKVLPTRQFTTFGYTWSLNPGKFNVKEHMVIIIMANSGAYTIPDTDSVSASVHGKSLGPLLTPDASARLHAILPHTPQSEVGQQLRLPT